MAKLDKSLYTKKQWKLIKEHRKKLKNAHRLEKEHKAAEQRIKEHQEQIQKELEVVEQERKDNKIAFVLGNGISRRSINPHQLKKIGSVYGCNALYREFEPDFLIAVDTKMILEINKSGYQKTHEVWTNPNKAYARFKGFNYFNPSKGWSSGPTALWLASQHQNQTIYILGFDYMGVDDGKYFNNLYADTQNYKKSKDSATFFGNWMRQTASVLQSNSQKRYIRVIDDKGYIPRDLRKFDNLEHITIEEFQKILDNFQ
jgi:hypothetical protein